MKLLERMKTAFEIALERTDREMSFARSAAEEQIASMDILPSRIDNLQCEIADPWSELDEERYSLELKAKERYLATEKARRIKERFGRKLKRVR